MVGPILLLLLSPFLLHRLGADGFGLWALAVAVSGIGGLASFGVGIATTKQVSEELGAGHAAGAVAVTRGALAVALTMGVLLLVASSLGAPTLAGIAFAKMGDPVSVGAALTLGVALLVVQEVDSVFAGALRGAQRFDRAAQVELLMRPVWAAAVAATAWQTRDTQATLLASASVNAVKALAKGVLASRVIGGHCLLPSTDRRRIGRVIHFGKWASLQGLGVVFFSVADRMLVGALLGAADLARYAICLQLTQFVHVVQAAALQPVVPWISGSRTDSARLDRMKRFSLVGGLACLVIPCTMAVLSPSLLSIWISPAFSVENRGLLLALFASAATLSFGIPAYHMLIGLGEIWVIGVHAVVGGLLGLLTALIISDIGIGAFAAGRMVYAVLGLLLVARLWQVAARASRHLDETESSAARADQR